MMTDPISDMLTRIRNALLMKKQDVVLPYSKLKASLATVLEKQGWLEKTETAEEDLPTLPTGRQAGQAGKMKVLKLRLKYSADGEPRITGLKRVSKPGQRIYAKVTNIPRVTYGTGATILSTSKGIMTASEARKEKLGGEIICQIW